MNFMSDRPGFCSERTGTRGMSSSSSSSSSSLQNKGLPLYTYHHQESYGGGGGGGRAAAPPEFSPTNNGSGGGDEAADDSDDHMLVPSTAAMEKEHMFDKVVTPSDVGKLNRLVIPKQHAEKYFPLDSSANEKGLLLNFEDRNGKQWRFRYSYWNSSQSYVMTKGWSRFVKEKKLDAGDIVTFQRGAGDSGRDRLFIEWRRRPDAAELRPPPPIPTLSIPHHFSFHRSAHPWNPLFLQPPSRDYSNLLQYSNSINPTHYQPSQNHHHYNQSTASGSYPVVDGNPCLPGSIMYLRSGPGGGGAAVLARHQEVGLVHAQRGSGVEQMVFESVPVVQGKAAAKRLRLFGVTMDCPISESDDCDILNSTTLPHSTMPIHHLPPPHNFLDFSPPSSSSIPSLQLRPNYNDNDDKGKGSMSLDLDI